MKIAIIPARGGSKRIPRKNIKDFCGKLIIAYSIETAQQSGLFDEVMVSTDDDEIAKIAKQYGAKVPFMRSAENADDYADTVDVILEVLDEYKKRGKQFEFLCCIYPTAPFIRAEKLQEAYDLMIDKNFNSVFPVVRFSYPIQRALKQDSNGKISMFQPENLNKRSQDLEPAYHDAGQFYWGNVDAMSNKKNLWTDNSGAIMLSETEIQDIDNLDDWKLAEFKFAWLKNK